MFDYIKCGDCVSLMKELPDSYIDLTVTSPPYDNLRTYKGYSFEFESVAQELYRITKQGGLARDQIISWSNEGDIIFDPFAGSGTTAKMAMLNNRHYIGFDISEKYCKIAQRRINEGIDNGH